MREGTDHSVVITWEAWQDVQKRLREAEEQEFLRKRILQLEQAMDRVLTHWKYLP